MKRAMVWFAAFGALLAIVGQARADFAITVANPSFESPAQAAPGDFTVNVIMSWAHNDLSQYGVFWPTSSQLVGSPPSGNQVAYINSTTTDPSGSFGQDVGTAVVAGDTYKLSFYVAPRNDLSGGTESWTAQLFAGSSVTPFGSVAGTVTGGSGAGFSAVTFTATAPLTATGDLIIQFSGSTTASEAQVMIDDVSLAQVTVPEPNTLIVAGCGILGFAAYSWRKRRRNKGA